MYLGDAHDSSFSALRILFVAGHLFSGHRAGSERATDEFGR
jgi:hypothetical protein